MNLLINQDQERLYPLSLTATMMTNDVEPPQQQQLMKGSPPPDVLIKGSYNIPTGSHRVQLIKGSYHIPMCSRRVLPIDDNSSRLTVEKSQRDCGYHLMSCDSENHVVVKDTTNSHQNKRHGNDELDRTESSSKKSRLVWTPELHRIFYKAVKKLGVDEATPNDILKHMKVPGLKRYQVASHLQKFRIKQRKLYSEFEEILKS